jgi:hypothetical protein
MSDLSATVILQKMRLDPRTTTKFYYSRAADEIAKHPIFLEPAVLQLLCR